MSGVLSIKNVIIAFSLSFLGINLISTKANALDKSPVHMEKYKNYKVFSGDELSEQGDTTGLVEVEPTQILPSDLSYSYVLVPYRVRKKTSGTMFTLSYSLFEPKNYESFYIAKSVADFSTLYGSATTALVEMIFTKKWHFKIGSIGYETSYGIYANDSNTDVLTSKLSLSLARVGLKYMMDNISPEPYFVPYIAGGAYVAIYDETQSALSNKGNTSPAMYYTFGALIQLDFIDKDAAKNAYLDAGVENTFWFIEARQFLASSVEKDPDFSTDLNFNTGLSLEF